MRFIYIVFFIFTVNVYSNPLQDAIDRSTSYSTIKLSSGIYNGNIHIDKPLNIIGIDDNVVIQGDLNGSVVTIRSDNVTLKNIIITNSGDKAYTIDSAISMKNSNNSTIEHCQLLNSLYGIDMFMSNNSIIQDNYITSKNMPISLKGDALKIYYSNGNVFKNNTIKYSRDVTLNYSNDNIFKNNKFINNRFASHISLSNNNKFISNKYMHNSVSIMLAGTKNTIITNNIIQSSKGAAGIGVVILGVSNFNLINNKISFNSKAIYIDAKEKIKGMKRYIKYNEISYNKEAIHFHQTIKDNTIMYNKFFANIDDVVKDKGSPFNRNNKIEYNYWDRYIGFDKNKDNIGDTSYKVYQYADQLWQYNHKIKFFYASPIMTLLNFISKLAPFIKPNLIIEDKAPIFQLSSPFLLPH